MSFNVVSLFKVDPRFRAVSASRDWTNQELAEFYRVEASLTRAGISVETDRGLSDEGEPWFVFARAETDDVIIHFARIDGIYIVASPAFGSCARGRDFRTLIEGLLEQHPLVLPKQGKGEFKLYIHPAALLVALVTTCFFKLGQTEALAADEKHAVGSHLGGFPVRGGFGTPSSQPLVLDERAAATLIAAVAVAVAWEQSSPGESHQTSSMTVADVAPLVLSDTSGNSRHDAEQAFDTFYGTTVHSSASSDTVPSPISEVSVFSQGSSASVVGNGDIPNSKAPIPIVALDVSPATAKDLELGVPSVPIAAPGVNHVAGPTEKPSSTGSSQETPAVAHPISGTFASIEISALLGERLQAHLVTDIDGPLQQFLLSLISPAGSDGNPTPSDHSVQVMDPTAGRDLPSSQTSHWGVLESPTSNTGTAIDQAIRAFMVEHVDFGVIKQDSEIIIYDAHLNLDNKSDATEVLYSYGDGSSVLLIGLPSHPISGAAFSA